MQALKELQQTPSFSMLFPHLGSHQSWASVVYDDDLSLRSDESVSCYAGHDDLGF